ncbi:Uncharacterized protein Rs2_30668 [Raphanus sativus]|nr:Uncharacterized protein Rs2_30668 [Raphanus sativus]
MDLKKRHERNEHPLPRDQLINTCSKNRNLGPANLSKITQPATRGGVRKRRCRRSGRAAEECRLQPPNPVTVYTHLTHSSYRETGSIGHTSSDEATFKQTIRPRTQLIPILCRQTHQLPQSKPHRRDTRGRRRCRQRAPHTEPAQTSGRSQQHKRGRNHTLTEETTSPYAATGDIHKNEPTTHLQRSPRTTTGDHRRNPKPQQRDERSTNLLPQIFREKRDHTATDPKKIYPATHAANSKDTTEAEKNPPDRDLERDWNRTKTRREAVLKPHQRRKEHPRSATKTAGSEPEDTTVETNLRAVNEKTEKTEKHKGIQRRENTGEAPATA